MQATEEKLATTFLFRPEDPRLLLALASHAKRTKRSSNKALDVILEDAMRQAGYWPPKPDQAGEDN